MRPPTQAAATAVPKLARGDGLSIMSRPPVVADPTADDSEPGSGRFSTAENRLRVQVSMVFNAKLYRKVVLVPFQTPQEPSRCHSCERTSRRESDLRRDNRCEGGGGSPRGDVEDLREESDGDR